MIKKEFNSTIEQGTLEKVYEISNSAIKRTFFHFQDIQTKALQLLSLQGILIGFYLIGISIQLSFKLSNYESIILGGLVIIGIGLLSLGAILSSLAIRIRNYKEIGILETILFAEEFPQEVEFTKKVIGDWSELQSINLDINNANASIIGNSIWLLVSGIGMGLLQGICFILFLIW